MAKKAKSEKRKAPEPMVSLRFERPLEFELSKELQKEPEALLRLAHRVVDILADRGDYKSLAGSVAEVLCYITDEVMLQYANELIREAREPWKGVPRG